MRETARRAVGIGVLLALAACGGGGTGSSPPEGTEEAAPPDPGPECVGETEAAGTHVLRGGSASLPGGGSVMYAEAHADGATREAELFEGTEWEDRHPDTTWTVAVGDLLTVAGEQYDVAQICTYRVVLAPRDPSLSPTPDPTDHESGQGDDMTWPITVDGRWRLRWHSPDTKRFGETMSVTTYEIHDNPPRAEIRVVASQVTLARYDNVRVGDTLEIADQLWEVTVIDLGSMDAETGASDFASGYVDLQRIGPAGAQ
jgi:hypothetical protein